MDIFIDRQLAIKTEPGGHACNVLSRRLAPHFTLDPTTFAGYLWITAELLQDAMENPDTLLRRIKRDGVSNVLDSGQLTLFD